MNSFSYLYNQEEALCKTNILKLVKETITLTKSETTDINKEVIFDSTAPAHEFEISSNPTYLSQIIFNLIINAAQAIHKKKIEKPSSVGKIKITLKKSMDCFNVIVSDTGGGIPQNILGKVFEPFFTTKSDGTGLGLSICKNLANQIGGDLSCLNNTTGPGSSFYLRIFHKNHGVL